MPVVISVVYSYDMAPPLRLIQYTLYLYYLLTYTYLYAIIRTYVKYFNTSFLNHWFLFSFRC